MVVNKTSDSSVGLHELQHLTKNWQEGVKTREGTWETGARGLPQDTACTGYIIRLSKEEKRTKQAKYGNSGTSEAERG